MKTKHKTLFELNHDKLETIQKYGLIILPWIHVDDAIDLFDEKGIDIASIISWEHPNAEKDESVVPQKEFIPHIKITAYDTEDENDEFSPTYQQVVFALGFASANKGIVIINCHAGKSRSTAFAYAFLCHKMGPGHEEEALKIILELKPNAAPNILIVKHADQFLNRKGAMVQAILDHPVIADSREKADRARWLWQQTENKENIKNPGGFKDA